MVWGCDIILNLKKVMVQKCEDSLVINRVRETISKRDCKKRPTSIVVDSLLFNMVRDLVQISYYVKNGFVGWIEEENLNKLKEYS